MKKELLDILRCPACLPAEQTLAGSIYEQRSGDILKGELTCGRCQASYPVRDGIGSFTVSGRRAGPGAQYYEDARVVSAYLWSHYADLFHDPEATNAHTRWAQQLAGRGALGFDAGAAVGRFAFEMSAYCDFVVGIDLSRAFIATARSLAQNRFLEFPLFVEGNLYRTQTMSLSSDWNPERVDFIIADALAPPFPAHAFSHLASLNLIDKLSDPLGHLRQCNRLAETAGARFLIADPFSWSSDSAPEDAWLGGTATGPYAGRGADTLCRLMEGDAAVFDPRLNIVSRGDVWWKIRHHENRYEMIRSHVICAVR
jgi:uncharacterized protein YbaR (Trm112 family)/SAM-dependent methyltransferase